MMEVAQEQWRRWGRPGTRKRKEARGDAVTGEGREGAINQGGIHLLVPCALCCHGLLAPDPGSWNSDVNALLWASIWKQRFAFVLRLDEETRASTRFS